MLARELGPLAVAVEVEPQRVTAIVLSPAGGGMDGLDVQVGGNSTEACGHGCYRADLASSRTVQVRIGGYGRARFVLPRTRRLAAALVRKMLHEYRALRSVSYAEHLASDRRHAITATWRLEKPNRVSYVIPGGAQGIVIGARRWDRNTPNGRWRESAQTPLPQPATQWTSATNAHVLAEGRTTVTVSFADPTIPGFFTVTLDARTLRPRVLRMTAAAHFMTDRYESFNEPPRIRPPR